ncbi:MAG: hypothetical protein M3Q08_03995 [Pseudomonadota bacterium]|nr:hypothetical protein [Pseudomonadota bacterium]
MDHEGYSGGGTVGGRWGCAIAALVCVPLLFFLILVNTLGDCAEGEDCKRGLFLPVFVPVALTGAVIGLSVRAVINWIAKRYRNGS